MSSSSHKPQAMALVGCGVSYGSCFVHSSDKGLGRPTRGDGSAARLCIHSGLSGYPGCPTLRFRSFGMWIKGSEVELSASGWTGLLLLFFQRGPQARSCSRAVPLCSGCHLPKRQRRSLWRTPLDLEDRTLAMGLLRSSMFMRGSILVRGRVQLLSAGHK